MEITTIPNKILAQKLAPVKKITPEITALISNMHEQMIESKGIGLAANQIGIDLQIFVIDKEIAKENNVPNAYLNPEITEYSEEESEMEEGCLSIPEYFVNISRPRKIKKHAANSMASKSRKNHSGILKNMRMIFFGTSNFAIPALEALVNAGYEIPLVITTPGDSPIRTIANRLSLSVIQPESLKDPAIVHSLSAISSSLGLVASYGKIIPQWLIEKFPRGL